MADTASRGGSGSADRDGVNVQVLLRCRPLSDREIADRVPQVITCNEAQCSVTLYHNAGGKQLDKLYRFDKVFSSEASQEKLYKQAIVPIVQEVMEGFNCTIFAYGQTGTGKTYTMEGGPRRSDDGKSLSAEAGVIPRSVKQIFDTIEDSNPDATVKVTFLELYNEELTDLLSTGDETKDDSKRLRLLEDRSGVNVQGLEEVVVKSAAEIYQVLDRGTAKRKTAETLLNKRSSRSHSVFSITIHLPMKTPEGEDVVKVGKLNLVDLAGSENISRSGAKDGRAREAGSINQSLLTLGRVITALVDHSGHVPYRDSKLTRLLRESLGGKTKTCIIATVAPTVQCQEETISTLDYAHRAKNIRNKPEVNQKISKTAMLKEVSLENERLRLELVAQREKNGVYIPMDKHRQDELERVQLRDALKALREETKLEIDELTQELEQQKTSAEKTINHLSEELAKAQGDLKYLEARLDDANQTIRERQYLLSAHRQAEQELAEHAEAIRSGLSSAVEDIGCLFASVKEFEDINGADRQAFQCTQDTLKARLTSLSSSLSGAMDSHRKQLDAMREALVQVKARKQDDLQQLLTHTATVQETIASLKDAVERRAQAADAVVVALLGGVAGAADSYVAGAIQAAQDLEATTKTAIDALRASFEQQTDALATFAQQQASYASKSCDTLRSTLKGFTDNLGYIQTTALETKGLVARQTSALSEGLGSFATQFSENANRAEAKLMASILAAVQAFASERTSEVAGVVQSLQQQAQEGCKAVTDQLDNLSQATTTAKDEVQEVGISLATGVQTQHQHVDAHITSIMATVRTCSEQASTMQAHACTKVQSAVAAHRAFNQDLEQACSQGTATVQGAVQACIADAGKEVASTECSLLGLKAALEAATSATCRSMDDLTATCTSASDDIAGTDERHKEQLAALDQAVGAIVQERLDVQRQVPPPEERELQVPSASSIRDLLCLPEEVLIARCRSEPTPTEPEHALVSSAPESPPSIQSCSGGENMTPMPVQAKSTATAPAIGPLPQSPRCSTAGLRSRIPSKPSLVPSSPSVAKDLSFSAASRQQLADKTNSKQGILSEWTS